MSAVISGLESVWGTLQSAVATLQEKIPSQIKHPVIVVALSVLAALGTTFLLGRCAEWVRKKIANWTDKVNPLVLHLITHGLLVGAGSFAVYAAAASLLGYAPGVLILGAAAVASAALNVLVFNKPEALREFLAKREKPPVDIVVDSV